MEYGKLYTILLGTVVSDSKSAVSPIIARYILDHIHQPDAISIQGISRTCHVSPASISRFCRDIGLQDFFELKELIQQIPPQHPLHSSSDFAVRLKDYRDDIVSGIDMMLPSFPEEAIRRLCHLIHKYERVAVFGWLKSEAAAWILQMELAAVGKNIYTTISHRQQIEYLRQASEQDLIIILSYRGIYFEYISDPELHFLMRKPCLCFITGSEEPSPAEVDHTIRFYSEFKQTHHPHQLLFLCNVIAREYARLYAPDKL